MAALLLLTAGCATEPATEVNRPGPDLVRTQPPPQTETAPPSRQGVPPYGGRSLADTVLADPLPPAGAATGSIWRGTTVGLLLPLTGEHAALGQAMQRAAEIAVFDVAGEGFRLLPRDTGGTADGARRAAREALDAGADIILGPVFAPAVAAIRSMTQQAGVAVIAFTTDWTRAGGSVYVMGFTPDGQVRRAIDFAEARGVARFAALLPATPYGDAVLAALEETLALRAGTVTQVTRYSLAGQSGRDLSQAVRDFADYDRRKVAHEQALRDGGADRLRARRLNPLLAEEQLEPLPFDAVVMAEGGERARQLARLLDTHAVDPRSYRFIGTGLWDDADLGTEPALQGGWFAAPEPTRRRMFEQQYQSLYGAVPPRIATLAYDAAALAAVLARRAGPGQPPFSHAALQDPNGFLGIDGIFRFGADQVAERGLAVLEIQPGRPLVIDAAPTRFPAPGL